MNIREGIQDIMKDKLRGSTIRVAEVVSVEDDGTCTCMFVDSETELSGVRLQIDEAYGIYVFPDPGSTVLLARISDFDFGVIMFSKVLSIALLDSSYGGLVKVIDLTEKLNNLENKLNSILTTLKTHTHPGVTVGAGITSPSADFVAITSLTPTDQGEIENTEIKHGASGDL